MTKKKGQKNKGSNPEKKQEETNQSPKATSSGDSVPTTKDSSNTSSAKAKSKNKKEQEKHSEKSSQSTLGAKPSTSTNIPISESATKVNDKQNKKKTQQEAAKQETAEQSTPVRDVAGVLNTSIESKKGSKKSGKKEKQKELKKPNLSELLDEPDDDEFTTQQSRKKRKQKKLLPPEEPPIQKPSVPKTQSKVVRQPKSETTVIQNVTQIKSCPLESQEVSTISAKGPKKQTQKKRSGTPLKGEHQSGGETVVEFQQSQTKSGDYIKRSEQRIIRPQQTTTAPLVEGVPFELTIPHRKTRSGTKGRSICIETNHLALNFRKLDRAVHYDVTITPSTPKKLFRKVMQDFRQTYYKDRYPAFDGTKNLYSSSELPFGQQIAKDITIYENERPREYKVVIKFANFVDLTPLQKFVNANPDGIHHMLTPQEVIQCLDIVLRSAPALICLPVGRSYFTPPKDQILALGSGMEMYYGFYQSAVVGWKPFLNIDVAHKAFPMRQNVIDLILELCELKREQLQRPLQRHENDNVDYFLRTLRIRYEVPDKPGSKREYRVNGLEKSATEATFQPESGTEITVEKYFFKEKRIILKYPHMPCLWVGNKDRTPHILLPAEFCTIIEGQVINRKMSEKLTSAMIKQTATSTKVRKDKIMDAVHRAQFNNDPCVREFGITVSEEFTKINARVLDPPALTYSNRSVIKPSLGAWRADKFLTGAVLSQWTIVILDRGTRADSVDEMIKLISQQATNLGMSIAQPLRPFITLQPRYKKELQELVEMFTKKKHLQLIMVIIPNAGLTYNYVKQAAELAVGCLTQCIRNRTVAKINASTVINLLQKINAKLEGTNHILNDRLEWMKRPYMIMGADVTHPSPDARDKPSVAAVTASYDVGAFKYNICWRLQPPKVEIIEDLEHITREQLLFFYNNTKHKPERIIFFRDGVSEGQFSYVLNTEIQAIRRACACLQPDGSYKPKITFLVVQKRHHTRFFPMNAADASRDRNLNVPVGTCVDTVITHPTALDFCLVSHASIQGVARPTKYRVLWDDADMNEDELEQLSFYFCHMFSRCTRSVSYPAPTYYAHLAAARIMAYCETDKLNMNNLAQEQERLCIKECIIKQRPMFFV